MIKNSEVKIGKPKIPTEWNEESRKFVEVDYKNHFIQRIKKSNNKELKNLDLIKFSSDTLLSDAQHYHSNYLEYLKKSWADHLGIVITPDIIWYTLISEFSSIIKQNVESYRSLFSDSKEKKEILIPSNSLTVMPLDTLSETLKHVIPSDSSIFFPQFQTFTINSEYALMAAFCDICSPYYNYCMYRCGFPFIDVRGSIDDWMILREQWRLLSVIIKKDVWTKKVNVILDNILSNFKSADWWKSIFKIEECGSGHQTETIGWFTDLFEQLPRVRYVENYNPHVSNVKYKQLETNKTYEMSVGLFSSILVEDCLEPRFSSIIYETTDACNDYTTM